MGQSFNGGLVSISTREILCQLPDDALAIYVLPYIFLKLTKIQHTGSIHLYRVHR